MSNTLVIATHNRGKAAEIHKLLGDIPWQLVSLQEFNQVGVAEEIEVSYAGNAVLKARYYAVATHNWVLADDSGLEVTALGGAPGVLSARYAGENASDADRRDLLLSEIEKQGNVERKARFVCSVAIADQTGEIRKLTEGVCEGAIATDARGDGGFGYDPIFIPTGYTQTFGELAEEIKNQISHRAKVLLQARDFLLEKNWPA
ncbi:MAG: non-canonical purine NTP pyrophosphatase, RdgB/HAM1 family [Acidobacteria bacterium]|nr:MAG: non-canonical purine NTP pyrophosphatase, RdgB/HAM1 family [Acidobacteriota bacterium]